MKKKRWAAAAMAAVFVLTAGKMTSFGAYGTKITSVSLKVEADITVGAEVDPQAVLVETRNESSKYTVMEWDFVDAAFSWQEEDIPVLKVTLAAEDGYYFSVPSDGVTLKGAVLQYVTRNRETEELEITMVLPPLAEQVTEIGTETLEWSSDTVAKWGESVGAGNYEVRIIRNGDIVGTTKITSSLSYDFSNAMTRPGTYTFKVRPVNKVKTDNKGDWAESPTKYVDEAMAERIRVNGSAGEWLQDETGFWYRNMDGSYTVNNWQQINGQWYFFDEKGYRRTGWIQWNEKSYYCDVTTGAMLVNTTTPDQKTVGIDGALIQ